MPVDWPAAIVIDDGRVAELKLLLKETTSPPGPAWPVSVTVPVDALPPTTTLGFRVTVSTVAGVMVKEEDCDWLARVAVIVAVVWELTPRVVTVNEADEAPDGTVMVAGIDADGELLDRFATVPFEPATPLRVTVPVELVPPGTVEGLNVIEARVAGVMVNTADWLSGPCDAVTVAFCCESTPLVVTVKLAFV